MAWHRYAVYGDLIVTRTDLRGPQNVLDYEDSFWAPGYISAERFMYARIGLYIKQGGWKMVAPFVQLVYVGDTPKINSVDMEAYGAFKQRHSAPIADVAHRLRRDYRFGFELEQWSDNPAIMEAVSKCLEVEFGKAEDIEPIYPFNDMPSLRVDMGRSTGMSVRSEDSRILELCAQIFLGVTSGDPQKILKNCEELLKEQA